MLIQNSHYQYLKLSLDVENPPEKTMKKAWEGFKADKEWIEVKKQYTAKYGDVVGNVEDRVLTKVDYSPN